MQAALTLVLVAASGAAAAPSAPGPGRYAATLCVATTAKAPPTCGAAEFDLRPGRQARVSVADIVYRLDLRPEQVDVSTMHGKMLIDQFSAFYTWNANVLRFEDQDKHVRYEVKVGPRQQATGRSPR